MTGDSFLDAGDDEVEEVEVEEDGVVAAAFTLLEGVCDLGRAGDFFVADGGAGLFERPRGATVALAAVLGVWERALEEERRGVAVEGGILLTD